MNPDLDRLHAYPFERLAALKEGITPPTELHHIALSIGEPRQPPPDFILDALRASLRELGTYPATAGVAALRETCAGWLERRFGLRRGAVDPASMVLPVNGTREALFAFAQAVVNRDRDPLVALPNPFYQIYEGAALLAGAEPAYLALREGAGYLPDLDAVPARLWERCQLIYACTPGNPTGAVMGLDYLERLIELADRHDFVIAGDECYCDVYLDEAAPPPGLLQACARIGRDDFRRCVVFHSLSKRSNVPGLRSGFVAGDPRIMARFRAYRSYHGCAVPIPTQLASIAAWSDDAHVAENRRLYREKFHAVEPVLAPVLELRTPPATFYLWPRTPVDGETFARDLFATQNVTVLPGAYLARDAGAGNPGRDRVRISLVAPVADCTTAAQRIRDYLASL